MYYVVTAGSNTVHRCVGNITVGCRKLEGSVKKHALYLHSQLPVGTSV